MSIGNNTHLQMGVGVTLVRIFAGNPTIANAGLSTGGSNSNIRVTGGKLTIGAASNYSGKHLVFRNVTGLWVTGMRFEGVMNDWNTAFADCDDVVISQIVMRSGYAIFEDGLHFAGCRRVSVSDSLIECGDDALSLTNESAVAPVNPLEDFVATNLYLYSKRANPVRISIIKAQGSSWTPTPIRRVRLANIVAKAGVSEAQQGGALLIQGLLPPESQELITDVEIDGFTFDASVTGVPLNFDNARRIRVSRFVAIKPGARAEIDACDDVELNDCVIDSPRTAAAQCLLVASNPQSGQSAACNNIRVVGGQYRNATQDAIKIGQTGHVVTGFEVSGALIQGKSGTDPTLNGLLVRNASGGIVRGNNITGCSFIGIEELAASNNNLFIANRVRDNALGGLTSASTTFEAARNYPTPGFTAVDSGGFRQTIDGWQVLGVLANQGPLEMTRVVGRFRAVRPASVTGIVAASSKIPTAGTLTVTVFKNANNAGLAGSSIGLSAVINPTSTTKKATIQNQDLNAASRFNPGDELYIVMQTVGWTVANDSADVFCALEIED